MRVHLTPISSNAKTGPIPVSTTEAGSCPDTCQLKHGGCYAKSGPLGMHWRKISDGFRGGDWGTFTKAVSKFPKGQVWRHNQAGDLPGRDNVIDRGLLHALVKANTGRRGFTYTHYPMTGDNVASVHFANSHGFTVNLSADNLAHAESLLPFGPVCTLLPESASKVTRTESGYKVVTCPATYRDDVSCATCGNGLPLCARADRDYIVGFPVHGTGKKKAHAVFLLKSI